jgi:hypothetical protein
LESGSDFLKLRQYERWRTKWYGFESGSGALQANGIDFFAVGVQAVFIPGAGE